jgi:hypothetical protein
MIGTRVEQLNIKKANVKSRNAGAGFEPAIYGFEVGFRAKTTGKDRQQKVN